MTDGTTQDIAELALKPVLDRLSKRATEAVIENFCKVHCGREPEVKLCRDAERVKEQCLACLFKKYAELN